MVVCSLYMMETPGYEVCNGIQLFVRCTVITDQFSTVQMDEVVDRVGEDSSSLHSSITYLRNTLTGM